MRGLALDGLLIHLRASFFLACTVYAYRTSLNANKKAAVMTLCVTLGPMPVLYQHPTISESLFEHSPPYNPAYPSSLIILLSVVPMLSLLSPLPATCIRLFTVM